jgi:hypothetical protein
VGGSKLGSSSSSSVPSNTSVCFADRDRELGHIIPSLLIIDNIDETGSRIAKCRDHIVRHCCRPKGAENSYNLLRLNLVPCSFISGRNAFSGHTKQAEIEDPHEM